MYVLLFPLPISYFTDKDILRQRVKLLTKDGSKYSAPPYTMYKLPLPPKGGAHIPYSWICAAC